MTGPPLPGSARAAAARIVDDNRLLYALVDDPLSCATVNEYATATGMHVGQVLAQLEQLASAGLLAIEGVGVHLFVDTAGPAGRDGLPANLWTTLRSGRGPAVAARWWDTLRRLQRAGWQALVDPNVLATTLGVLGAVPYALDVRGTAVPVLRADDGDLVGRLRFWAQRPAPAVAVLTDPGQLEPVVARLRRWQLEEQAAVVVLVLEAPGFSPVVLHPADGSVSPAARRRSVRPLWFDQVGPLIEPPS